MAILVIPAIILSYVWLTDSLHLQTPQASLDTVVPAVTGGMFVVCLWSIWRSSWTWRAKILGTLGALVGVAAGAMVALMVLLGHT
jgi:hypothetical protein